MTAVSLRNAHLHAQVLPDIGGGLARLDAIFDGNDHQVLRGLERPPGAPAPTPSQLACFPLLPWSNRIGGGGFVFEGRAIALVPNRAGEPCPIHGEGWQRPWEVAFQTGTSVHLALDRRHGAPFSYRAQLRYTLRDTMLEVALEVQNCGSAALPFGLGLHPWLPRTEGVTLRARAHATWRRGDDGLPLERIAIPGDWDFNSPRPLPAQGVDNVFDGWDGEAEISWPETGVRLRICAGMAYYIVYTKPGADFFCFEPVDHLINAHNLPGGPAANGLSLLGPGQSLARTVTFSAGALA
ncbi:aldose 1-epimerase [Massilia glaciei]|uniref:Aldose 1-epimerase n=1 Tax=Massilia glaciei TaxID=1524097 RepID=A0A2U2HM41_9BURK|nr:aldose 1-epimerase [Massilia glaciei]PWF48588.1 aldose 1-epimerase [Massilia glaciei]